MSTQVRNLTEAALLLSLTFLPAATRAKSSVDLNPNLDFTKYKTFAFIGGVEHLAMRQPTRPRRRTKNRSVANTPSRPPKIKNLNFSDHHVYREKTSRST